MTRLRYDAVDHFLSAAHRLHANTQPHIPHPNPDTAPPTMAQHESHVEKSHLPHEVSSGPFKLRRHLPSPSFPLSRGTLDSARVRRARRVSRAHNPVDDRFLTRWIRVARRIPSSSLADTRARRRPEREAATTLTRQPRFFVQQQVHHDYTWLVENTAKSHTLKEIIKHFKCTEQGAKNAMSRRGISECKDWIHDKNAGWKTRDAANQVKITKEFPVSGIVGKRVFDDGNVQYKVLWKGHGDEQTTWEPVSHLHHCQQAVTEYEKEHQECCC